MKTATRLFVAGLALGASCLACGANQERTYAVIGFYEGRQPKPELVNQAAVEIGQKMKDRPAVAADAEADQVVQVLFKRDGTYRIFWDALPLNGVKLGEGLDRFRDRAYLAFEAQMETATGHGRANVH